MGQIVTSIAKEYGYSGIVWGENDDQIKLSDRQLYQVAEIAFGREATDFFSPTEEAPDGISEARASQITSVHQDLDGNLVIQAQSNFNPNPTIGDERPVTVYAPLTLSRDRVRDLMKRTCE